MASSTEQDIAHYYTHGSLLQSILDRLTAAGIDPAHASADDLAPVDELHIGGRPATVEFADELGFAAGMRLLDVGSGIGGPSRYFAGHRGCHVTGIDLTPEFCETARELSARTGLSDRTEYRQASGVAMPFEDSTFDGAYMIHVGMNVEAKAAAFREVARVLKPGAIFGIYDVMRDAEGEMQFPVPWASTADTSFVESAAAYVEYLHAAGFESVKQRSRRDFALAALAKMQEAAAKTAPIMMGPSGGLKLGNLSAMVQSGLLSPAEIISRKR
jgi:ubiquinone/menaquinone biosynthesis C-methylase UbiE